MLGLGLGLLAALLYGAADFIGGLASRRSSTFSVVVISQAAGLLLFFILLPLLPHAAAARSDFGWGLAAGVSGGIGIVLLYRGLAIGRMSMVSPVTAVLAALIPLAAGLLRHERPSALSLTGVALALVAVVLVSASQHPSEPAPHGGERGLDPTAGQPLARARILGTWPPGLIEALLSGVAIGGFLLFLAQSSHSAGLWPLAAARVSSIVLFSVIALAARRPLKPQPRSLTPIVGAGVLDMSANACYLLATRHGLLSLVVVLASLYPASTVLLARLVLNERLTSTQMAGVGCSLAAIALIAGGSHV